MVYLLDAKRLSRITSMALAGLMIFSGLGASPAEAARRKPQAYGIQQHSDRIGIVGVQLTGDETTLLIKSNRPFATPDANNVSTLKLPHPDRMVIEIPNAELATGETNISINRQGIRNIELSESKSPFYSSVRVTIFASDYLSLARMSTAFENNVLRVEGVAPLTGNRQTAASNSRAPLPAAKQDKPAAEGKTEKNIVPTGLQTGASAPTPSAANIFGDMDLASAGKNVIENIFVQNDQLMVKAASGSEALRIKNRFKLSDPTRLVLDLDNTVLASRDLLNPVGGPGADFKQVRVGQFDEKTVRIVIETGRPDDFEVVYNGPDRRQIAISPNLGTSITKLSSHTELGHVQDFKLEKERGVSVLRLSSDVPMVHRYVRRDDKVYLELLNIAARPGYLDFDRKDFPEVDNVRLEPLTSGQPNSKMVLSLNGNNFSVQPRLYDDGRTLELTIAEAAMPILITNSGAANGATLTVGAPMPGGQKAPYPARIVIDAGHGGKDMGANRQGVMEKDLNLSLALMLKASLEARGFQVYMTRGTDVFLPLPEITRITNSIKPDLFVSIHHNASTNAAVNGMETYYYTPQSKALAQRIHARMVDYVPAKNNGVKTAMFYVIHHTAVPAVLCEIGYVSNPTELADLQTMERKQRSVRAITDGVVDYLKTRMSAQAK